MGRLKVNGKILNIGITRPNDVWALLQTGPYSIREKILAVGDAYISNLTEIYERGK
jgi:hypothetical protein